MLFPLHTLIQTYMHTRQCRPSLCASFLTHAYTHTHTHTHTHAGFGFYTHTHTALGRFVSFTEHTHTHTHAHTLHTPYLAPAGASRARVDPGRQPDPFPGQPPVRTRAAGHGARQSAAAGRGVAGAGGGLRGWQGCGVGGRCGAVWCGLRAACGQRGVGNDRWRGLTVSTPCGLRVCGGGGGGD